MDRCPTHRSNYISDDHLAHAIDKMHRSLSYMVYSLRTGSGFAAFICGWTMVELFIPSTLMLRTHGTPIANAKLQHSKIFAHLIENCARKWTVRNENNVVKTSGLRFLDPPTKTSCDQAGFIYVRNVPFFHFACRRFYRLQRNKMFAFNDSSDNFLEK